MEYKIRGTTLQVLDIQLQDKEKVFTEAGGMSWMSTNIEMETKAKGGIGSSLTRTLTGESFFMTEYTCTSGTGLISFSNEFPGKIVPFNIGDYEKIICQRDAFMVAESSVTLETELVKKLGAGFFGGEGFFLQKVSGSGMAFMEFAGEVTQYTLNEGQTLKIDPAHLGAFESTVKYDITRVKGVKNMIFGGEGLFLATVTGPGNVWLQSMPIANLVTKLMQHGLFKKK